MEHNIDWKSLQSLFDDFKSILIDNSIPVDEYLLLGKIVKVINDSKGSENTNTISDSQPRNMIIGSYENDLKSSQSNTNEISEYYKNRIIMDLDDIVDEMLIEDQPLYNELKKIIDEYAKDPLFHLNYMNEDIQLQIYKYIEDYLSKYIMQESS